MIDLVLGMELRISQALSTGSTPDPASFFFF